MPSKGDQNLENLWKINPYPNVRSLHTIGNHKEAKEPEKEQLVELNNTSLTSFTQLSLSLSHYGDNFSARCHTLLLNSAWSVTVHNDQLWNLF